MKLRTLATACAAFLSLLAGKTHALVACEVAGVVQGQPAYMLCKHVPNPSTAQRVIGCLNRQADGSASRSVYFLNTMTRRCDIRSLTKEEVMEEIKTSEVGPHRETLIRLAETYDPAQAGVTQAIAFAGGAWTHLFMTAPLKNSNARTFRIVVTATKGEFDSIARKYMHDQYSPAEIEGSIACQQGWYGAVYGSQTRIYTRGDPPAVGFGITCGASSEQEAVSRASEECNRRTGRSCLSAIETAIESGQISPNAKPGDFGYMGTTTHRRCLVQFGDRSRCPLAQYVQ